MPDTLSAALAYVALGWAPIPVPHREKGPLLDSWQDVRINAETAAAYFNGAKQNIGVILGAASGGLCDLDLDCSEAMAAAPYILPRTALFGRTSKRGSHWVYRTNLCETQDRAAIKFMGSDKAGLLEVRMGAGGRAAQTIFPPSTHVSGEPIEWADRGACEIADVGGDELIQSARRLAAASELARNYPKVGGRHDAAFVLGGFLARCGLSPSWAAAFVEAVGAASLQPGDKRRDMARTARDGANAEKCAGFPALAATFGEGAAKKAADWLGYTEERYARARSGNDEDKERGNYSRPTVRLIVGEIERIVDEAEAALIKARRGLYQRDNRIVFVAYSPAKTATGADTATIQILERGEHALIVDMAASANFERFDKRVKGWVAADPPISIVKALQQHGLGKLRFPTLHGVITAPTIRADGSILGAPGYDAATGLLFDARGVDFPAIPERPTRAEAERAFATLGDLLTGFPFVERHDRSVALSAILTACVRRSLPTAPLHAFSAPSAGTGKGKLVDIACVIATGFKAAPLSHGGNEEEMEKRLASKLMAGEPFIAIDNCTRPLGGDLICSMLTQEKVSPRILGLSKSPPISTGAFVAANGNNLVIRGDLTRRTLRCRIDAKVEQPENRVFRNDPVNDAMEKRADLVVAALIILRAYHVVGRPKKPSPLGSFEAWSDLIRGALMWLGAADPVDSMNELRKSDPVREAMRAVMGQWYSIIGSQSVTSAEIIGRAVETHLGEFVHADFRDALMVVAGKGGMLNGRALGNWLESKQDTIVDSRQIMRMGNRQGVALWALWKE
jgi:hypothetical protein